MGKTSVAKSYMRLDLEESWAHRKDWVKTKIWDTAKEKKNS